MKISYIVLAIIIIIILYSYCYFIYPSSVIILQTTLNDFSFDLLLQKQPLVISDRIVNITNLIDSWFSPNFKNIHNINNLNIWHLNTYKYLYIHSLEDNEILLLPANKKLINNNPDEKDTIVAIKLHKNQSLIIPYRWHYYINGNMQNIGINDYVTYVLQKII